MSFFLRTHLQKIERENQGNINSTINSRHQEEVATISSQAGSTRTKTVTAQAAPG